MYHQINPTEMFRERQLALLKEAENGRLARRLHAGRALKARSRKAAVLGILAALVVAGFMLVASSSPAHASTTFTVNSTGDENDIGLDGVCDVSGSEYTMAFVRELIAAPVSILISLAIVAAVAVLVTVSTRGRLAYEAGRGGAARLSGAGE